MSTAKKNYASKLIALAMALCLCLSLGVSASAASIDTSGGSGTTPVNLTTTNDGLGGDTPAATKMSVTVPTALPMAMSDDGTVVTATDCKIVNNSYGAVRVKTVTISAASDWHLTSYGDKSTLASEKVDSNKLGFALTLGNGSQVKTSGTDATQTLISSPVTGCYMTGVGDTAGNTVDVAYSAIVTPLSSSVKSATVANVVFVIEWDI
jgi:hypothetical protein